MCANALKGQEKQDSEYLHYSYLDYIKSERHNNSVAFRKIIRSHFRFWNNSTISNAAASHRVGVCEAVSCFVVMQISYSVITASNKHQWAD